MFFRRSHKKNHFTDEELIRLYQSTHDTAYVGELYQRYTHLVYGMCLKYLKDEEDSKDAVMQIFEKIVPVLKNQEVTKFQHWLHVLVRNFCLMELRSRKNRLSRSFQHEVPELLQTTATPTPENTDRNEIKLEYLEKGLEEIPAEQKICLELFYLHKKSYQEIANQTGFEINKVKSYIQNGKRNLKIYLEKHHDRL
ncbi:MAG: RNA polymerase subunit sigma-24 [Cytophagales bacterium CG18_big_fil_WC_8_21_14_2_50_42_9]|nr:MAG: RNA polymerase subunit sigma-24 [Cytophagales bacterium CG18_big_fil_WC_8_21_14_2_50_42_9]